jgi:hypothetical protein
MLYLPPLLHWCLLIIVVHVLNFTQHYTTTPDFATNQLEKLPSWEGARRDGLFSRYAAKQRRARPRNNVSMVEHRLLAGWLALNSYSYSKQKTLRYFWDLHDLLVTPPLSHSHLSNIRGFPNPVIPYCPSEISRQARHYYRSLGCH